MGILLFVGLGVVVCSLIGWGLSGGRGGAIWGAVCALVISALVLAMVIPSAWATERGCINRLVAFREYNLPQYDRTVELAWQGVEVDETGKYILDAANLSQVNAYTDAVLARQKAVTQYNDELTNQRYWENHWLCNWVYPNAPDSLDYIQP